ncbi:MAG: alkaline phosphatase family protein [Verrucomicrobia bacterium]|nr:alkaline phosphatase family protein [Verrucomicrobiota bacterium]
MRNTQYELMPPPKVLLINIAALAPSHLARCPALSRLAQEGWSAPMKPVFPAVTCTAQATLTTGKPPAEHGIIANGLFDRDTLTVGFWEQPAKLVQAPRIWDLLKQRKPDATCAVLFWQHTLYANADVIVTPRPIHLEDGMIQWCYSKPAGYYEELCRKFSPFKLHNYWGPLAGIGSSRWIAAAAVETLRVKQPSLTLVYLPHLDYAAQKHGPQSAQALRGLQQVDDLVEQLVAAAGSDTTVFVVSEYSMTPVTGAILPNQLLRRAGLLAVREIKGQEFLDIERSDAWAMADHQVAHVYCKPGAIEPARAALAGVPGVEFRAPEHARSGELVALAPRDKWFAYYWWLDDKKAPSFARRIDIHRKPGYDPCELWFNWPLPRVPLRPGLVKGSHGRDDVPAVFAVRGPQAPARAGQVEMTEVAGWILDCFR